MATNIYIQFGEKLKEERLKQGLSQERLAVSAGYHRTWVGMIERGERTVTLVHLEKIARALRIEIEILFRGLLTD